MKSDVGLWMLAGIVALFLAVAFWILGRAAWQSPEIRDVPATVTPTVRVIVLPTYTPEPRPTMAVTAVVPVIDLLPRETATRVPTSIATPAPTSTPVPPTPDRPPVQRG